MTEGLERLLPRPPAVLATGCYTVSSMQLSRAAKALTLLLQAVAAAVRAGDIPHVLKTHELEKQIPRAPDDQLVHCSRIPD